MPSVSESVRKITTFFLAAFLWLHAIFLLNPQSVIVSKVGQLLRLNTSETLLFALPILFSFAAGSGFWRPFLSLFYIYAFPFVLLLHAFRWCFLLLRGTHRWLKKQSALPQPVGPAVLEQKDMPVVPTPPDNAKEKASPRKRAAEILQFLLRPFRRFTFLWCVLLLVSTHRDIVRLSLIVVLFHLARDIFRILQVMLFSDPWLRKIGTALFAGIDTALAGIAIVTPDTAPTPELRNAWNQLNLWTKIVNFLKDPYLVSRWAWVLGILFFGAVYTYVALLFSFAYYGIARVGGTSYSWLDAMVTSLFIPFFVSELPKMLALKLLGGIQCVLVLAVGIGTLVNFIQRRLQSIHNAAVNISRRLSDQDIRDKFLILEAKLATVAPAAPPTTELKS
jgi:hypothetical protein